MLFKRILKRNDGSQKVSAKVIEHFSKDPDFPFLISFPRTGSHWLRMVMELYFEKPSLVRSFYFHNAKSFTCLHTHDLNLDVERRRVIYLYRNPVDTIYSQISYHKEEFSESNVIKWAELYNKHLKKWLLEESFTTSKVLVRYENLKENFNLEFKKITSFFELPLDEKKLQDCLEKVSKEKLKLKTKHDPQVVNLSKDYTESKEEFRNNFSKLILGYFNQDLLTETKNSLNI